MLHASIDIGTNSVLLLIASWEEGLLVPKIQKVRYPRLGRNLAATGLISHESFHLLMEHLLEYRQTINRVGARIEGIAATEAFRRAENGADLLEKAERLFQVGHPITIEVLTGERESQLAYRAVGYRYPGDDLCVLDIGGGSTEISLAGRGHSISLGAVSLLEKNAGYGVAALCAEASAAFTASMTNPPDCSRLVIVGGTATSLAMMELALSEFDPDAVEGVSGDKAVLEKHIRALASMTTQEKGRVPGLEAERADIILPGLCILASFLEWSGLDRFTVSCLGLRHGILLERCLPESA